MDTFNSISQDELERVAGGKHEPHDMNNMGGSSGSNDQLLTTLQGIQSSLKDLSKNQNNQGLFGGANGLMFMTMALAMSNRRSEVVVTGGGSGCRRRICWRSW